MVNLRIAVPDGADFAAKVPPQMPIGRILDDFLSQWQPPPDISRGSFRYSLRPSSEGAGEYSPGLTLQQMGEPVPRFELVLQALEPDSPVGLTIENARGERYTTAVLLKTRVSRLADVFLEQQPAEAGEVIVELVAGEPDMSAARRLDLNASLYDEGVDDHAVLRIYQRQEQGRE